MPIDRRQKGVTNMAARQNYSAGRQQYARRSSERNSASAQMYVYGNVVTKPAYEPRRHEKSPERPVKRTSRQVRRNRRQALHMSSAYVVFLTIAALMALIVCVNYVQLQSRITSRSKNITAMQEELADMKEENNTKYNAIMDSVNLDEIRDKAQTDLGMVYASPQQVVEYDNPATDYVKQYESIPEDGVLAQSDKNSK
ncbi:hypothetical protein CLOSCI_01106 [[Clostridium] scindens ATCC 35704]|nr:hypothetical protein CLOSCI_01106 [[Clostridium] scindens ATCC 35704]